MEHLLKERCFFFFFSFVRHSMNEYRLLLILFATGAGLQSYQSSMKNHSVAMLFFIIVFCPLVPLETICFQPSTDAHFRFIRVLQSSVPPKLIALCAIQCIFFCLRYSALFSMERLLPEWMPQVLWVLKEVSLLRQCVDSPSLFETRFWSIHEPFFLRFSLTCKRWSVSPLGQAVQCLILLSMFLMHSMQPLVLRLHYFKCLMGKYFRRASNSYLVRCCFKM